MQCSKCENQAQPNTYLCLQCIKKSPRNVGKRKFGAYFGSFGVLLMIYVVMRFRNVFGPMQWDFGSVTGTGFLFIVGGVIALIGATQYFKGLAGKYKPGVQYVELTTNSKGETKEVIKEARALEVKQITNADGYLEEVTVVKRRTWPLVVGLVYLFGAGLSLIMNGIQTGPQYLILLGLLTAALGVYLIQRRIKSNFAKIKPVDPKLGEK